MVNLVVALIGIMLFLIPLIVCVKFGYLPDTFVDALKFSKFESPKFMLCSLLTIPLLTLILTCKFSFIYIFVTMFIIIGLVFTKAHITKVCCGLMATGMMSLVSYGVLVVFPFYILPIYIGRKIRTIKYPSNSNPFKKRGYDIIVELIMLVTYFIFLVTR